VLPSSACHCAEDLIYAVLDCASGCLRCCAPVGPVTGVGLALGGHLPGDPVQETLGEIEGLNTIADEVVGPRPTNAQPQKKQRPEMCTDRWEKWIQDWMRWSEAHTWTIHLTPNLNGKRSTKHTRGKEDTIVGKRHTHPARLDMH